MMPKTKSSTNTKISAKASDKAQAVSEVHTTVTQKKARPTGGGNIFEKSLVGDLTVGAVTTELVGTFILVSLLLATSANPIVAGISVLFLTIAFMRISGGHANPATTVALMVIRQISVIRGAGYIIAQLLGAILALVIIAQFMQAAPAPPATVDPYTGQPMQAQAAKAFALPVLKGDWLPMLAEAFGALLLGMGVAASRLYRRDGLEAGFLIGGALLLGMLFTTQLLQGAVSVLNPAAALGMDGYKFDNLWTIGVYAIGPIIGAAAGAGLYRLLKVSETKEA